MLFCVLGQNLSRKADQRNTKSGITRQLNEHTGPYYVAMSLKEEQVSIKQDPEQEERQHDQFNDVQIKQEPQDHDGVDSQYTNGTQNDDNETFDAAESGVKAESSLGMGITSSQSCLLYTS